MNIREISFTIQTIDCVSCSPWLKRSIGRIEGVREVLALPITNKIIVRFDDAQLTRSSLVQEILGLSKRAGYGGMVIVQPESVTSTSSGLRAKPKPS